MKNKTNSDAVDISLEHDGTAVEFLTVEQVVDLHDEVMLEFTPSEPKAIKDNGLLESAVMAPQQTFGGEFLYKSLSEMAATYLIGLAQNHAFMQGNKRIAFAACSTFLQMNGYQLTLTNAEAVSLTMAVINHEIDREEVAAILDAATQPL